MANGKKIKDTSWGPVAEWYDALLEGEGTYQKELILPNLLRLMEIRRGETVLDLGCGQGFFTRAFAAAGADAVGADASRAMIAIAERTASAPPGKISFRAARADSLPFIKSGSVDKAAIVLALQNMENAADVLAEGARVLRSRGELFIVLNHPAFRIPKASAWGWDEKEKAQYRRIDRYLSELKVPIAMHPGKRSGPQTLSFHRPLQFYFKALNKEGFAVAKFEEWSSHRKSQPGPRAKAEDLARKEIPLFLCIVAERK